MIFTLLISLSLLVSARATYLRGEGLEDRSILLGDRRFASREEFIATGARCRTADLSPVEVEAMELRLATVRMSMLEEPEAARMRSIRVFFHVITTTSGSGTVSEAKIDKQMAVLNRDFANSDAPFVFTLAGVDRTANNAWASAGISSVAEAQMKAALRRGTYADLNIYTTAQSDSTLGWATFPGNVGAQFDADGVVVDYRSLPGGSCYPYNEGRTVTHEVGHWMGLFHTFRNGCAANGDGGDAINDTPAEKDGHAGCPADSTNTCPGDSGGLAGNDPIHNYMDYTDDSCMNNFTPGQVTRMRQCWAAYRSA